MGDECFDVVVVGSGATGGWAAKLLAESGVRVIVLDAGPDLVPRVDLPDQVWTGRRDETDKSIYERQHVQRRHGFFTKHSRHLFVDDVDYPYQADAEFSWIRSRQVGGRTSVWGGVALRMSDHELGPFEFGGETHAWPYGHVELDRFYSRVEEFLEVGGDHDQLPELPNGNYRHPGPELTPGEQALREVIAARWPRRSLISLRGVRSRRFLESRQVDAWPRFSSPGSTLADAIASGRCSLRPNTVASKILTAKQDSRRAIGVECIDLGTMNKYELSARVVVLAASSFESVRLMLASASEHHPDGIGNSSGALGRYVMDHWGLLIAGTTRHSHLDSRKWAAGGPNGAYIPRFVNLPDSPPERFVGGYGVHLAVQRSLSDDLDNMPGAPFVFYALGEMMPRRENRISLIEDRFDRAGMPVLRFQVDYCENDRLMVEHARTAIHELTEAAGYSIVRESAGPTPPGSSIHEVGGARMGLNPGTSVVDASNHCWDVPNLVVVDGASWPTCGYQNCTLTLMAVAMRATEELIRRMQSGLI